MNLVLNRCVVYWYFSVVVIPLQFIVVFNRLELAEERAQSLTGQKTANECMEILKVIPNVFITVENKMSSIFSSKPFIMVVKQNASARPT